jgi:hypothetical protein
MTVITECTPEVPPEMAPPAPADYTETPGEDMATLAWLLAQTYAAAPLFA